jgi:hypothetical protein
VLHQQIDTETWPWECVGAHQGPGFLGAWQARAYVAERPQGWYASAEGQKIGREYTYRLPGRNVPCGPYPRDRAVSVARQMIGLAPDASVPPADQLVLYQVPSPSGREVREAKDVTGRPWTPFTGGRLQDCAICGEQITGGWAEGRWKEAHLHVCAAHVDLRFEPRPAES